MLARSNCALVMLLLAAALNAQQAPRETTKWYPAVPTTVHDGDAQAMKSIMNLEPMPMVAPIFIEDGQTSSSIVIVNNSAINAGATVSIRSLAGSEILNFHQALTPHQQVELSLQSLLTRLAAPVPAGSITVTQDSNLEGMTVISQLLMTNRRGSMPTYVDEELAMPSMEGSKTLRGLADEAMSTALIAITNIDPSPQRVTFRCISEKREYSPAVINLAANATALVSSCSGETVNDMRSYLDRVAAQADGGVKAFELVNDGLPGTVIAFGLAPHQHKGDIALSAIPFTDPGLIRASDIVFAGVPFGPQPTLPDGVYSPRISFTNFSTTPAHVTVNIATTPQDQSSAASGGAGNSPELRPLQQLTIPGRRTAEFVLKDPESQVGLLQSLVIQTDAKAGDLLSKVVSRSDGNLYEIELLGKDRMDENNGGIHPWSVEDDFQSHLLLFNYSDKPRVFGVGIWNGAVLWDKKYTLSPYETREINFNELIRDKIPDDKGQTLSSDHLRGVVNWMVPDSGEGTGRLMVTSHSQALARNFSCGQFIVVCGMTLNTSWGGVVPINTYLALYTANPQFCDEFSPSQCYGGSYVGSGSASYSWSIGTTNIVRPNAGSDQYAQSPNIFGVGAGTGSASVTVTAGNCSGYGYGNPEVLVITSISPSTIPVGGSGTQVTISGTGFGTSPTLNLPPGVTASNQHSGDAQITVTLTAASSAAVGNSSLSVSESGSTSNAKQITLDGPYHMIVEADVSFNTLGSSHTRERDVTYQLQNFSGSNPGPVGICENPTLSGWNCTSPTTPPYPSFAYCNGSAASTQSNGQFTDKWTFGPTGDSYIPAGCGENITDYWYWQPRALVQNLGTLNGYIHTDQILINNVLSPASMPVGTVIPF